MYSCNDARLLNGCIRELLDDCGQALVEAPLVLVITMMLVLVLIQPAVMLYTHALANGAAAAACRIAATDDFSFGGGAAAHQAAIESWVIERKLAALPKTGLFQAKKPEVAVAKSGDWVTVTVTIKQKPLPLVSTIFATTKRDKQRGGLITIEAQAKAPAALMGVSGSQSDDSGTYGQPRSR